MAQLDCTARSGGPSRAQAIRSTRARFELKPQAELFHLARGWNYDRIIRGVQEVGLWRLLPGGALLERAPAAGQEARQYDCEEVRTWEQLPGTVVFQGCNCPDEECYLRPLRDVMSQKGGGTPIFCKHHWIRLLLAGHTIGVPPHAQAGPCDPGWFRVTARAKILK